jgi:hypothetical protein
LGWQLASRIHGFPYEKLNVKELEYDLRNPRFKGWAVGIKDQDHAEKLVRGVPKIADLEESISKIGVVDPLYTVKENGKYRVIEGNQRLCVLRHLLDKKVPPPPGISWDTISAFVLPKGTPELEIMRIQAVLQQTKRDWPPEAEGAHYYELVQGEIGDTEEERTKRVAESVKVTPGYIRKRIKSWKEWKAYVEEMKLPPEVADDKYSYFFDMTRKTRSWFEESPETKLTYYKLITPGRDLDQKIRSVKKSDGLDDFEKVVDKPDLVKKLEQDPDYTLAEAVADAEYLDPISTLKGLKAAKTLADTLSRASKEQIKELKSSREHFPHLKRLHDVIERRLIAHK